MKTQADPFKEIQSQFWSFHKKKWKIHTFKITSFSKSTTGKSRFKYLHFSFNKSSHVLFKKDLCTESKNRLSKKMSCVGEFAS